MSHQMGLGDALVPGYPRTDGLDGCTRAAVTLRHTMGVDGAVTDGYRFSNLCVSVGCGSLILAVVWI